MHEDHDPVSADFKRYAKQIRFPRIGRDGQSSISLSRAVLIGCGALGTVSANLLARAGVGELLIVDRDFVELDNLQRQVLFDENDIGLPKSQVATEKLRKVNSQINIDYQVTDVNFRNIESFLLQTRRADIVIDGTDNFEIRFLINDACVKHGLPWIYGGCLGAEGQVMNIIPGETGCLSCLMMDGPPPPGTTATCDSSGVLATIVNLVASIQVNEALKLLSGNRDAISNKLQVVDLWSNRMQAINLEGLRNQVECPVCKKRQFQWLDGKLGSQTSVLCGRNSVQLSFPDTPEIDLSALSSRLSSLGETCLNRFMLRFHTGDHVINVFRDGRAIISGTEDIAQAKKLYAQYIGT